MSKRDKTSQKLLDSIRKTKKSADTAVNTSSDAAPASAPAPVLDAATPPAEQRPPRRAGSHRNHSSQNNPRRSSLPRSRGAFSAVGEYGLTD